MKKILFNSTITMVAGFIALLFITTSCVENLLDQEPTTELGAQAFWKTEDDALYALYGAYSSIRPLFDRDYYYEGNGEFMRVRSNTASTTDGNLRLGDAYRGGTSYTDPSNYGSGFDKMYRYLYGGVNRANYVIENVNNRMLPNATTVESRAKLEAIIGEARLLRGMVYFRLISMWGDVPYFSNIIYDNSEVANIARTPIAEIKDSIMADFTYAIEKLPEKTSVLGRAAKPAAYAFRGKLQLYWACWNNFGWPELDTFKPSKSEATAAYTAAAADFKKVINDFGLTLYKNGEPGVCDPPGKADNLPNYFYLFTPLANGDSEMIMSFTHGGTGTSQGEELMRDFAGRTLESSQCWLHPRYELADRYQKISTGDFAPPMKAINPNDSTVVDGKKVSNRQIENSAVNPESYADRDYRMKSTIMWDFERCIGMSGLKSTGFSPYIYKTWNVGITNGNYKQFSPFFTVADIGSTTYNTDGTNSGYVCRKFVRNYAGQGRSDGDFSWPVMRLADVFLMYAEATNEISGPQADAIALVNKVRYRGNLPALKSEKTANKEAFFNAIEQERIIELFGEGHRGFDLRRWRAIERVWGPPYSSGVQVKDTQGALLDRYFQNKSELTYQRCYIFRIPPGERDRNPNLTQNTPWL